MSHPSKLKTLSYPEAVRLFNDDTFLVDLKEGLQTLSQALLSLLHSFESVSRQLHSFDLQGLTTPLKPNWNALRKDCCDLVAQFRANAGFISGRLRMFCTVVLPLTVRNQRSASQGEKMQVLHSFTTISSEHARHCWSLAESVARLTATLNCFHTEFSKFAYSKASSGHQELRDLCQKFGELEATAKRLYYSVGKLTGTDVTYLVYSTLRLIASVRRRPARVKISHQHLAFPGVELTSVFNLYQLLDRTQNETAHAHYTVQVAHRKTDLITAISHAMSKLVSDEIMTVEPGLTFFLAVWSRLQTDCTQLSKWLSDPRHQGLPLCVSTYLESGKTLYGSVADALDIFVSEIDPIRLGSRAS